MDSGFIMLYRKITHNELWNDKPFTRGQAWIDILLNTNHSDKIIIKRGLSIEVKRGQCAISKKGWANRWGWSQGKVTNFLRHLKKCEQIEYQADNQTTLITIVNYDEHHPNSTKSESKKKRKLRADGEQAETTNNVNNKKEYINPPLGSFKNVLLKRDELDKLIAEHGKDMIRDKIDSLSEYMSSKGKTYKSHYATILSWIRKDIKDGKVFKPISDRDAMYRGDN